MGSLKVKLTRSFAGAPQDQLATIRGLGLRKFGDEKLLPDTKAVRGLVFKVKHLVTAEPSPEEFKKRRRNKPRKIRARDAARARQQQQAGQ
jgi:large subunit ribosomal protein L30